MVYSRRIIEAKQNLGASSNIKAKARELRTNMTDTERDPLEQTKKKAVKWFLL